MDNSDGNGLQLDRYEVRSVGDLRQVFEALERRDDASVWDAARRAPSQASFFEDLRHQVSSTTYFAGTRTRRQEKVKYHCSLVFIPLVLDRALTDVVDNPEAVRPAIQQVRSWLQEWFEHKVEVNILTAVVGYEEVCVWTPSVMREKLERLAIHKPPTISQAPNFDFHLPAQAPELAFFVAAVHRPLDWPRLPGEDAVMDEQLASRVSGAVQVCSQAPGLEPRLEVLTPDFASDALREGILRWLQAIAGRVGIRRWDAQVVDQDLVVLQLELGDDATATTPIPLRAHQLGLGGIEAILDVVSKLGTGCLSRAD